MFIKERTYLSLSEQTNRGQLLINRMAQYSHNLDTFLCYFLFIMHSNNVFAFCWSLQIRALCLIAWSLMSLRAFSEQFQFIYSPGAYFKWFLQNTFLHSHQHFFSHWVPGSAWWPQPELFLLPCPACRLSQLNSSSAGCLEPCFGCVYWLPNTFDVQECDTTNCLIFGNWVIMYGAMQCLTGRGTVQRAFNSPQGLPGALWWERAWDP